LIGGAYLAFGRKGVLATSGVFFAIVAWAIGKGVIGPLMAESTRCSESAAMALLPPRTTRPARVVFAISERRCPSTALTCRKSLQASIKWAGQSQVKAVG
jgi:hypothetical protein